MKEKFGFTLIELTIVIFIIAIIVAITVPALLSSRVSANEQSAVGSLKLFTVAEATWFLQDTDCNGRKDYWTYDVSCLHRMKNTDGITQVKYIPFDLALADAAPVPEDGAASLFGSLPTVEALRPGTHFTPKSGYWFQVLLYDNLPSAVPPGEPYKKNLVGTNVQTPAANSGRYGFIAAPDAYGSNGIRTFIINETGTIFSNDTGDNSTTGGKWATTSGGGLVWPTGNPRSQTGPAGKLWEVIQ